jgi:hypothetical protein
MARIWIQNANFNEKKKKNEKKWEECFWGQMINPLHQLKPNT